MAGIGIIESASQFLDLHREGPLRTTQIVREYSVKRELHEPIHFSSFQISAFKDYCQGLMLHANIGKPISIGKRIFNQIFYLFDRSYNYVPEGGRVWKMPGRLLAEVRNWILTRVVTNNQEEMLMAAQIVTDLMQAMQAGQFYNLAQTLDLAETICFIGYISWAEGKGTNTRGRTVSATIKGGGKFLNARVVLEPRTWADALTVITTNDLKQFQSSDIRRRKIIQIFAGGELTIVSVRIWIPTTSQKARGFWIVCVEQDSRTRRQIGTFGLADGTIHFGIGSSMMARIRDNRLMFRHSAGWQTWEGGYQEIHTRNMGSTGTENEGGEPGQDGLEEGGEVVEAMIHEGEIINSESLGKKGGETEALGDKEEEEIVSPTVSELGAGDEEPDESFPAFTVLKKDGKAKLKKRIEDALRVKFNTKETAELFQLFPMPEITARNFLYDITRKLREASKDLSHVQSSSMIRQPAARGPTGLAEQPGIVS
jgi:hypothetical protein